jgi:hypothetical protein
LSKWNRATRVENLFRKIEFSIYETKKIRKTCVFKEDTENMTWRLSYICICMYRNRSKKSRKLFIITLASRKLSNFFFIKYTSSKISSGYFLFSSASTWSISPTSDINDCLLSFFWEKYFRNWNLRSKV